MTKGYDTSDLRPGQQTGDVGPAVLASPARFSSNGHRRALLGPEAVRWIGAAGLVLVLGACSGADRAPADQSVVTGTAAAADGTPIAYRDFGGDGPALVLLTGLGNSAAVYDDFAPRFTDEHRVVAITRRGFADSGMPAEGYDVATRASDDLAVLDALEINEAVFVGHSVAGSELAELGTRHRDRVTGLVFLDATHGPRSADQRSAVDDCISFSESWMPAMAVSDDRLGDEVAHAQARFPFPLPPSARTDIEALTDISQRGEVRWTASGFAMAALREASSDLSGVAVSALAIVAVSRDPAVHFPWITAERVPEEDLAQAQDCADLMGDLAEESAATAAANPQIQTQVWQDAHHHLFLQSPQQTQHAIEAWLAGLQP